MRIEEIGEQGLIGLIQRVVSSRGNLKLGIGDDCLVLADGRTVLSTDCYAEGVHFDLNYLSYYDVGARCACAALSDVVAMGAEPQVLLVGLLVPKQTGVQVVKRLYQGMERVCAELGAEIGGGDIVAFDRLVLCLTAVGSTGRVISRSGAEPGDFVYLTGYAGLAETGRLILAQKLSSRHAGPAVERHRFPWPRIGVMRRLRERISAMIDTSDGLATDVRHLSRLSQVRVVISPARIPVHPATVRLCQRLDIKLRDFVFRSGEDYELLFTSRSRIGPVVAGVPVHWIGKVEPGSGVYVEERGRREKLNITGYDHLKSGFNC
ncbi:MAG: thiamine-phosphate kinase [candidate division WOR-3 bacterium]